MIEQILKVSFLALKKIKSGNFKSVKEELDILNINYSDDDLLAAFGIAQETESIEEAITPKTKAIMVAHTLGNPFNLNAVKSICEKNFGTQSPEHNKSVDHNLWKTNYNI